MERAEVGEQGRRRVPAGPGRVAPGECVREGLQEVAAREAVEGARRHRLEIRDHPVDHGQRRVGVGPVVVALLEPAERREPGGGAAPCPSGLTYAEAGTSIAATMP